MGPTRPQYQTYVVSQSMPPQITDPTIQSKGFALVVCTHKRSQSLKRFLQSLAAQDYQPDQLIIVDASPDDDTQQMLQDYQDIEALARSTAYVRVSGSFMGITRQRNVALRLVTVDLIAFFDDDIVLLPNCLREMELVHRACDDVVGVGAFMYCQSRTTATTLLWYMRLFLRMMTNLQPGRYHRSGISTPWSFLYPTDDLVEGDWLPGCAVMWKTATAREVGFYEGFAGYARGEDLDFSLRARGKGRLVVAGSARVLHLYDPSGRPDPFSWGYMAIYNRYQIHRRALPNRTWWDIAWFIYTWTCDTLLLVRHFMLPPRWGWVVRQMAGRLKAVSDILRGY